MALKNLIQTTLIGFTLGIFLLIGVGQNSSLAATLKEARAVSQDRVIARCLSAVITSCRTNRNLIYSNHGVVPVSEFGTGKHPQAVCRLTHLLKSQNRG